MRQPPLAEPRSNLVSLPNWEHTTEVGPSARPLNEQAILSDIQDVNLINRYGQAIEIRF